MGASKYMAMMGKALSAGGGGSPVTKALKVIAAYGLIQGMTSDLNVAWTRGHYRLVNWLPTKFLILFASAWSLTENYPLALITCAIYYGAGLVDSEPYDP